MPEVDKRDTVNLMNVGGSDTGLQVYLPLADAEEVYGSGAVAGWYNALTLDGGTFAYEIDSTRDKDEAGQYTGKIIESNREWVIQNTVKEFSPTVLKLFDVLGRESHKYRYGLPFDNKQDLEIDGTGTIESRAAHHLFGLYNGLMLRGWEVPTQDGEPRTVDVDIRGTERGTTPGFVNAIVDLDDETTWQYQDVHPDGNDLTDFETA